jgi:hypothetical protein
MTTIQYAYSRFSIKRFPLPSEAQLQKLEQRIKVTFPDDYRQFCWSLTAATLITPTLCSWAKDARKIR